MVDENSVAQVQIGIAEQIVFLCRTLQSSLHTVHNIDPDPDLAFDSCDLRLICEVLETSMKTDNRPTVLCLLIALQPILTAASLSETYLNDDILKQTRAFAWKLVCAQTEFVGSRMQEEACRVLLSGKRLFYPSDLEQSAFLTVLLGETDDTTGLILFRNLLLSDLADELSCSNFDGSTDKKIGK